MEPPYEVSYAQHLTTDDVRDFATSVGLYSFQYHSDSHLEREAVRYNDAPIPSTMLASMVTGPAEKLSHHIQHYSGRENDGYVRDIDLTVERQVTAPVSLTFTAELEETMLKLSNYDEESWMESVYTPVEIEVATTVGDETVATGELTLFIDYLEDWEKD